MAMDMYMVVDKEATRLHNVQEQPLLCLQTWFTLCEMNLASNIDDKIHAPYL